MIITISKTYTTTECCTCGADVPITVDHIEQLKKSKRIFYCINGHSMSFTKSTADILQEKLNEKNKEISVLEGRIRDLEKPKKTRGRKAKNGK